MSSPTALAPRTTQQLKAGFPFTREFADQLLHNFRAATNPDNKKLHAARILHFIDRLNKIKAVLFDMHGVLYPGKLNPDEEQRPSPGAQNAITLLKKAGIQTFVLSNGSAHPELRREMMRKDFGETALPADHIIFASEIGVKKPERAAFEAVEKKSGLKPEELACVDDTQTLCDFAQAYGYLSSLATVSDENPLDKNFLLRELATGEWRKKAEAALQESERPNIPKLFIKEIEVDDNVETAI